MSSERPITDTTTPQIMSSIRKHRSPDREGGGVIRLRVARERLNVATS